MKNNKSEVQTKTVQEVVKDIKKEGFFVYKPYSKPKIKSGWFMCFQESIANLAKDKELPGQALKVFLFLMGNLDFENFIHLKQTEIADELGIQKTNLSNYMKLLVDKGLILKIKDGTVTGYKLNPHYAWKGSVDNRNNEDEDEDEKISDGSGLYVLDEKARYPSYNWLPGAKTKIIGDKYLLCFQNMVGNMSEDREITGEIWRVFAKSLNKLDFENFIYLPQQDLIKELNICASSVSRALRILTNKNFLLKRKESMIGYKLNPNYEGKIKISNAEISNLLNKKVVSIQKYKTSLEKNNEVS